MSRRCSIAVSELLEFERGILQNLPSLALEREEIDESVKRLVPDELCVFGGMSAHWTVWVLAQPPPDTQRADWMDMSEDMSRTSLQLWEHWVSIMAVLKGSWHTEHCTTASMTVASEPECWRDNTHMAPFRRENGVHWSD